jgi:hypothetical protein
MVNAYHKMCWRASRYILPRLRILAHWPWDQDGIVDFK